MSNMIKVSLPGESLWAEDVGNGQAVLRNQPVIQDHFVWGEKVSVSDGQVVGPLHKVVEARRRVQELRKAR